MHFCGILGCEFGGPPIQGKPVEDRCSPVSAFGFIWGGSQGPLHGVTSWEATKEDDCHHGHMHGCIQLDGARGRPVSGPFPCGYNKLIFSLVGGAQLTS